MQIVKYPPIYSPAFGEVVFQISAAAEERQPAGTSSAGRGLTKENRTLTVP